MVSGFGAGIAGGATVAITIKAIDKYSKEFRKAETSMQKIGTIAKTVGIAAAGAFAAFTASAVQAGLKMKPIEDSFKKLAKGSDLFLRDLNEATRGTISNFELMSNANKALLLGLDQEALPNLFKNAAIVGRAAGRTTTEAIADITLGIGRQSRMILDNLGIIIKADDVYSNYANSVGKATEELTAQEKQMAFNSAAMEALQSSADNLGGLIPEDAITDIQRLTKGLADFNIEFGKAFVESFQVVLPQAQKDYQKFGKSVGKWTGIIASGLIIAVTLISGTITTVLGIAISMVEMVMNRFISGINIIINGFNRLPKFIKKSFGVMGDIDTFDTLDVGGSLIRNAKTQFDFAFKAIDGMSDKIHDLNKETVDNVSVLKEQNKALTIQDRLLAMRNVHGQEFKVIAETGDVFNPGAFTSGEFQTSAAYNLAKGGGGTNVNIYGNIMGLDPQEIARALREELTNQG